MTVYASFLQRPPIDILVDIWMADEKYPIFSKEHHFCLRRSNTAKRSTTVVLLAQEKDDGHLPHSFLMSLRQDTQPTAAMVAEQSTGKTAASTVTAAVFLIFLIFLLLLSVFSIQQHFLPLFFAVSTLLQMLLYFAHRKTLQIFFFYLSAPHLSKIFLPVLVLMLQ